jgi:hypothetical protein
VLCSGFWVLCDDEGVEGWMEVHCVLLSGRWRWKFVRGSREVEMRYWSEVQCG